MSDVRESAERLRRMNCESDYPDYGYMDGYEGSIEHIDDLRVLAHAYLAANPPDDLQPLDENWLRSVGFKAKKYQGDVSFPSPLSDSQWIECTESASVFLLCRYSPMYDDDTPPDRVQVTAKTRGDVRLLAKALGIALKE